MTKNSPQQPPANTAGGTELPHAVPLATTDDDPLLAAYERILGEARKQRPRLMTDRLMAVFIRDKMAEDFETFVLEEGLGR